jgi:hypothetical protein
MDPPPAKKPKIEKPKDPKEPKKPKKVKELPIFKVVKEKITIKFD